MRIETSDLLVRCPDTGRGADFIVSSAVQIHPNHQSYFQTSKSFLVSESRRVPGALLAHYFHGLSAPLDSLTDLPRAYTAAAWARRPGRYPLNGGRVHGTLYSPGGKPPRRHVVNWPEDAWFQLGYKGHTLWAYNRASALELYDYLASSERNKSVEVQPASGGPPSTVEHPFLKKIPSVFLTAKARPDIVRKLRRLLAKP
jgi:hypothetical protein